MSMLSDKELKHYQDNGFVAPIDVLSSEEVKEIKREIENIVSDNKDIEIEELIKETLKRVK